MQRNKRVAAMLLVLCFALIALGTGLQLKGPRNSFRQTKTEPQSPNFEQFPIVDFDEKEPSDPAVRSARAAKGRKYSKRYLPKISETTDQLYSAADWDVGLPAIPNAKSSAIVIGTISKSEAHVTENRTAIYSEFTVYPDVVVKNDLENPVEVRHPITFQRNGGRVRMPSGKIVVSWTSHQNMPRVGSRYVLFLTHDFETKGDTGKDFYLLTGYEIRTGRVFPLDDTLSGRAYKDVEESLFLKDLFSSVASTSIPSN